MLLLRITVRVAIAVLFLSLAIASAVHAAGLFHAPAHLIDTRGYPTSVAVADLDGDGRPDLVTTSAGYPDMFGKVSVGLGNGDGTFQAWTHFDTGSWPFSVAVGDLNEDGFLDVVTANADWYGRAKGSLSILLGRGDGTFAPRTDLGTGRREQVAIVDLDSDGHLDLMTDQSVLLGEGDGTFAAEIAVPVWSFALGDFNGDGRLDLVSPVGAEPQAEWPAVMVRLGNGDGTFGPATGFGGGGYTGAVAVGDVNRDGRPDIAVAETYERSNAVSVLLGNGDGTFGSQRRYQTGMNPASVAIADLDGDGSEDVVTANYGFDPDADSNTATVLLGNGDGSLRPTPELCVGVNPVSLTVADLNADGRPDLVMANDNVPGTITVVLGNHDGLLGTTGLSTPGSPVSVAIADLDNDGRQDLVAGQGFSTGVSVFLGTGDGAFGPRTESEVGSFQTCVAVADLDGDGRMDIAATDFWSGVAVKLGNGDGTFGPSARYATGRGTRFVTVADLNEDQRPELLVANNDDNTISMLLGNGDGTFGAGQTIAAGYGLSRLAVADLDGDGHLDLAASNGAVLLGRGDGTFESGASYGGGGFLAIGDLNGDETPDIAASSGSTWLGNGDGTFRLGSTFDPGISPSCLVMADFDQDGRLDVAMGNEDVAAAVTVLLGLGDGTFGVRLRFGVGKGTPALATGDLNGDGLPDLASANFSSRSISLLFGNTVAPFKRHAIWRGQSIEVPAPRHFALEGFRPNPALGAPAVAFTLADASPATIEVLDLAGRRVLRREVGGLGAGRHLVPLKTSTRLAPGAYVMRLRQAGRTLSARGVVVR